MTVMVHATYTFSYTHFGGGGGGPILSLAVDGGPLTANVQFLGLFGTSGIFNPASSLSPASTVGAAFGGNQSFSDVNIYSVAPSATLSITRYVQLVKNNVADGVNNYAVSLRGIGVSL